MPINDHTNKKCENKLPIVKPNPLQYTRIARPGYLRVIVSLLFFAMLLNVFPADALALDKATFSWQANPPEDYVLGYRLYYGTVSRYRDDGLPKANFSYAYYIDFFHSERCVADGTGTNCERLDLSELRCEDLYQESPRCTVFNLPGEKYFFAMTAYNAEAESGYTQELSTPFNRKALAAIQAVNLLLKAKAR